MALKSYPIISELLIAHGARVEDVVNDVLSRDNLVQKTERWKVELMLAHLTPATLPDTLLRIALADSTMVKPILKTGMNPNAVLVKALNWHLPSAALAVVDAGASLTITGDKSVLIAACFAPFLSDVVRRLLEIGAHPDHPRVSPPLRAAINSKSLDSVRLLLAYGADPDRCNAGSAALARMRSVVPDLLLHGATLFVEPAGEVPLGIMGLLLRARIPWAHRLARRLVQWKIPQGTDEETARAMAMAKAALEFPDMQPKKLA